jgi:hypothetical protein
MKQVIHKANDLFNIFGSKTKATKCVDQIIIAIESFRQIENSSIGIVFWQSVKDEIQNIESSEPEKTFSDGKFYWVKINENSNFEPAALKQQNGFCGFWFFFTNGHVCQIEEVHEFKPINN